ncbi:hypothetical protein [Arthrobacter pascens]|uniref:hypothetical protein n=1 Tax=Arthrobacter pascens TaxID=1677 RepID=UPI003557B9DD
MWAGGRGEGAKYWLGRSRRSRTAAEDVSISVCAGLKGQPDASTTVWEQATVKTCMMHLIHGDPNSGRRPPPAISMALERH